MENDENTKLLFNNLPYLLKDMENKSWIIDSFPFQYKRKQYIVILKLFKESDKKPSKYAKAEVEFITSNNINSSIKGYIDFFNVHFDNVKVFCDFFGVEIKNANRNLFQDFSRIFSKFIPNEKTIYKNDHKESKLIGSRAEGNNPNAIYCFDVRRNGSRNDGLLQKRSTKNSNKTQSLRPELYKKFCSDKNLSFFFSDKKEDEKSDPEIMRAFSKRTS